MGGRVHKTLHVIMCCSYITDYRHRIIEPESRHTALALSFMCADDLHLQWVRVISFYLLALLTTAHTTNTCLQETSWTLPRHWQMATVPTSASAGCDLATLVC